MSFANNSSDGSTICSPLGAANMVLVRWPNRPRNHNSVCIVVGYGGNLWSCAESQYPLFSEVDKLTTSPESNNVHAIGNRIHCFESRIANSKY